MPEGWPIGVGPHPSGWSSLNGVAAYGVACSNAVQGSAAAAGLGAMIVRAQPLFQAIKWAGVAYLAYQVRRTLDATTGAVLLGFGARLATEHV